MGATKEYQREYYQRNRERLLAESREYTKNNPEKAAAWWKRHTERTREKRKALRAAIIEKHGGCCARCGFLDIRALQIDHVNGNGWKDGSRMGRLSYLQEVLDDTTGSYQILCANCNWIKREENAEMPFSFSKNDPHNPELRIARPV